MVNFIIYGYQSHNLNGVTNLRGSYNLRQETTNTLYGDRILVIRKQLFYLNQDFWAALLSIFIVFNVYLLLFI